MAKTTKSLITSTILAAGILAVSLPAFGAAGDIILRVRGIGIIPTSDGYGISPGLLTTGLDPRPMVVPEVDITYMITNNIGIELIAATSPHDLEFTGANAALGDAGDLMLLPPTLLLQYHFQPDKTFRPYVGAGINYTIVYAENASKSLEDTLGPTSLHADNSLGWAIQAGFDYDLSGEWFLNFDVKYIDIDTTLVLKSGAAGATRRQIEVEIDPVIVGIGVGIRF